MNLDEQCARAMGWEGAVDGRPVWFIPNHAHAFLLPPPFSSDIGYARLLEDEIERRGAQDEYLTQLNIIIGGYATEYPGSYSDCVMLQEVFFFLRATPEQRAQAFLKVINHE